MNPNFVTGEQDLPLGEACIKLQCTRPALKRLMADYGIPITMAKVCGQVSETLDRRYFERWFAANGRDAMARLQLAEIRRRLADLNAQLGALP
jgi:hypothetical protein